MTPRSMIAIPLTVLFAASAVAQPVSEGGRKFVVLGNAVLH